MFLIVVDSRLELKERIFMFKKIKVINYFFLIICIIISCVFGFFGVAVYYILAVSLAIYISTRGMGVTKYIKREYPELYERRKLISRMTRDGNYAVNLLALKKFEINNLSDEKIVNYIYGVRGFIKIIIISFIFVLFIAICKYLLER